MFDYLFDSMERFLTQNIDLIYFNSFLSQEEATNLYNMLTKQSIWRQQDIKMFGKIVKEPRLTAWFGDEEASYTYSGITMKPKPWSKELLMAKSKIEEVANATFNSVLLNWYRNGHDYMSWHSDDERELGSQPVIASLSLGAKRSFQFRKKEDHKVKMNFELENGSLLLMQGNTQHYWKHQLPKRLRVKDGRINLTFRRIL